MVVSTDGQRWPASKEPETNHYRYRCYGRSMGESHAWLPIHVDRGQRVMVRGAALVSLVATVGDEMGPEAMTGPLYNRYGKLGKSAGGPQKVTLRSTGWRPNPPESKKSARLR